MNSKRWIEYFLPAEESREPAFREELSREASIGLRAIGYIGVFTPLLAFALATALTPNVLPRLILWRTLALTAIGVIIIFLSRVASVRRFARVLGALTGFTAATALVVSSLAISRDFPEEDHHLPGNITLVMLVCLAALRLKQETSLSPTASRAGNKYFPWVVMCARQRGSRMAQVHP